MKALSSTASVALVILLSGCASEQKRSVPAHDSGTGLKADLIVTRRSASRFEIDGVGFTFGELVQEIRRRGSHRVLVHGVETVADALCVAQLGTESGAVANYVGADGKAESISFTPEPGAQLDLAQTCRG